MSVIDLLLILLIAGLCGATAQAIVGYSRGGCLAAVGIGFIGALIGIWLARVLALPGIFSLTVGGTSFPVVWAILGSSLFVAVISMASRRR